jgi:methylenetetrahydrofolate dehydrogenase (NADP+)/methenyltetrahydrofolate cyclohydrolase
MPGPLPCAPAGVEALLAYYDIGVVGREVVIVGCGATLGRALAVLLVRRRSTADADVAVVRTGVKDWACYTRRAGILVAAAGVRGIVQPEHVKPGAVVVGGGVRCEGRGVLPDVDESVATVAGAITPACWWCRPHRRGDAVPLRRCGRRTCRSMTHARAVVAALYRCPVKSMLG